MFSTEQASILNIKKYLIPFHFLVKTDNSGLKVWANLADLQSARERARPRRTKNQSMMCLC